MLEVEEEDEKTNKSKLCGNLSPFCCLTIAQNWISKNYSITNLSPQFHPSNFILYQNFTQKKLIASHQISHQGFICMFFNVKTFYSQTLYFSLGFYLYVFFFSLRKIFYFGFRNIIRKFVFHFCNFESWRGNFLASAATSFS